MQPLADIWRRWRRQIKSSAPFVRRRTYRILLNKNARLIESLDGLATPASQARLEIRKPLTQNLEGEVCLFVTYAAQPVLKTHVIHHLERLLESGLQVILIVNTNLATDTLTVDADLEARLSGVLVRENTGFDFGAWSHAYSLLDRGLWHRLYLINDSIVGPLNQTAFDSMMGRIKASSADFIGLTESLAPARHLQSYFLVFNRKALLSQTFNKRILSIQNLPEKGQVVAIYEIRLTQQLCELGLHFEVLFPTLSRDFYNSNDTASRWEQLLSTGFPYLKTSVIKELPRNPKILTARAIGQVDAQI
jgi:lipopolysaccharide biosynthesis protein